MFLCGVKQLNRKVKRSKGEVSRKRAARTRGTRGQTEQSISLSFIQFSSLLSLNLHQEILSYFVSGHLEPALEERMSQEQPLGGVNVKDFLRGGGDVQQV